MHKVASLSFLNHILMESSLKSGLCQGGLPRHYQKGVSMRGWVFLPRNTRPLIMLRGEPPSAQFVPFCAYWGGVYPSTRGLVVGGQGGLSPGGGGAIPLQGCIPSPVAIVAGAGQNPPATRHQAARFIHPPPIHPKQGIAPPCVVRWCHCGVANSCNISGPPSAPRAGPAPVAPSAPPLTG